MKYDKEALAVELVTKRRGRSTITMRDAAAQSGTSLSVIHKAETRKPISEKSFTKICHWLEVEPEMFLENGKV